MNIRNQVLSLTLAFAPFSLMAEGVLIPLGQDCTASWDANPGEEHVVEYNVEVGTESGFVCASDACVAQKTVMIAYPKTSIDCSNLGLDLNKAAQYYIKVNARNNAGWGEFSEEVAFEFGAPLPKPSVPTGVDVSQK